MGVNLKVKKTMKQEKNFTADRRDEWDRYENWEIKCKCSTKEETLSKVNGVKSHYLISNYKAQLSYHTLSHYLESIIKCIILCNTFT